jgi:hypothetical protein
MHYVDEKCIHFDCKTSQEERPFVKSQHQNTEMYVCTYENGMLSALQKMKETTSGRSCIVISIVVVGLMVN